MHETIGDGRFCWQEGYGAFSTSAREDRELRNYICTQKDHHRTTDFLDEFRTLLEEAGIKWNPRFLA